MGIRHKAKKAILEVGTSAEWNDDHQYDFEEVLNDEQTFLGPNLTVVWDTAETVGGSAPDWLMTGAAGQGHASMVLNTGALTGNISSMRHKLSGSASNITSPANLPVLTTALQIEAVNNTGTVAEWGFFESAVPTFTANQAGAYFRIKDDNLYAVVGDGAAETEELIGNYDEYAQYRVEFNSANVKFYVDDLATPAETIITNRPNVDLTIKLSVISVDNVDSTINVDAIGLRRLRKN